VDFPSAGDRAFFLKGGTNDCDCNRRSAFAGMSNNFTLSAARGGEGTQEDGGGPVPAISARRSSGNACTVKERLHPRPEWGNLGILIA
jgi:hypothetical protein